MVSLQPRALLLAQNGATSPVPAPARLQVPGGTGPRLVSLAAGGGGMPPPHLPTFGIAAMEQSVLNTTRDTRPANTTLAYEGKQAEFVEFCRYLFPSQSPALQELVTDDKLYMFLWYQSLRGKRKPGKKRRSNGNEAQQQQGEYSCFDPDDYNAVKLKFLGADEHQDPINPVKAQQVHNYKCAVRQIWMRQVSERCNSLSWEQIYTYKCQDLTGMVKKRRPRVDKAQYKEKIDGHFAPYLTVGKPVEALEQKLWEYAKAPSFRVVLAGLRNRFCFLQTFAGILRGESLFKAELSDLLYFNLDNKCDPSPMQILILQIATGKTNHGQKLYGRVLRHKNPELCAFGSLGFYLFYRFHFTHEMEPPPDFTENKAWFDMKLMIDATRVNRANNTTHVSDQGYAKVIKKACLETKTPTKHFSHFGRVAGPAELEMMELDPMDIKLQGNWNPDVQETRYSAKLPLRAMRGLAGSKFEKGSYYNFRVHEIPADREEPLEDELWPFVDVCLEQVYAAVEDDGLERFTAIHFLLLLKHLRLVILQDAACLMELHGRADHPLFRLPIFHSPKFAQFRVQMRNASVRARDRTDDRLSIVAPTINASLQSLQSGFSARIDGLESKVDQSIHQQAAAQQRMTAAIMAAMVQMLPSGIPASTGHADDSTTAMHGSRLSTASTVPPQQQQEEEEDTAPSSQPYQLPLHFPSVASMFREWYGRDVDQPRSVGGDDSGGISCRDASSGATWRKHFTTAEKQRLSRLRQVMNGLTTTIERDGISTSDAVDVLEVKMQETGSLTNLVTRLKEEGLIKTVARPNRKRARTQLLVI